MFTNIIHPLRKAFNLSMNEYAVLDSIYFLSHNNKYGGWCIASKETIANELDLGERTVFAAIEKAVIKGLVEKGEKGYLRTTDQWNEIMANKHDWYIAFKGKESQFVSGKTEQQIDHIVDTAKNADTLRNSQDTLRNLQDDPAESADNNNKEQYNNQNISKDIQASPVKSYGNEEINKMLIALKEKIGIEAFVDSRIERNIAKHCVTLLGKIGKEEFVRRLDILLKDTFHHSNCNKILYVYNHIKGFIEPKVNVIGIIR